MTAHYILPPIIRAQEEWNSLSGVCDRKVYGQYREGHTELHRPNRSNWPRT